jgi:hypothetical protein
MFSPYSEQEINRRRQEINDIKFQMQVAPSYSKYQRLRDAKTAKMRQFTRDYPWAM